jgi:hypothetical protein
MPNKNHIIESLAIAERIKCDLIKTSQGLEAVNITSADGGCVVGHPIAPRLGSPLVPYWAYMLVCVCISKSPTIFLIQLIGANSSFPPARFRNDTFGRMDVRSGRGPVPYNGGGGGNIRRGIEGGGGSRRAPGAGTTQRQPIKEPRGDRSEEMANDAKKSVKPARRFGAVRRRRRSAQRPYTARRRSTASSGGGGGGNGRVRKQEQATNTSLDGHDPQKSNESKKHNDGQRGRRASQSDKAIEQCKSAASKEGRALTDASDGNVKKVRGEDWQGVPN